MLQLITSVSAKDQGERLLFSMIHIATTIKNTKKMNKLWSLMTTKVEICVATGTFHVITGRPSIQTSSIGMGASRRVREGWGDDTDVPDVDSDKGVGMGASATTTEGMSVLAHRREYTLNHIRNL